MNRPAMLARWRVLTASATSPSTSDADILHAITAPAVGAQNARQVRIQRMEAAVLAEDPLNGRTMLMKRRAPMVDEGIQSRLKQHALTEPPSLRFIARTLRAKDARESVSPSSEAATICRDGVRKPRSKAEETN